MELLLYKLALLFFSFILSRLIIGFFLPKFHINLSNLTFNTRTLEYLTVVILMIGTIFTSLDYFNIRFQKHLHSKNYIKDTIVFKVSKDTTLNAEYDSVKNLLKKQKIKDSIVKYMQTYYDVYCKNDSNKLDKYYSFPLVKFYKYSPATKRNVHERSNFEFLHRKYKECNISSENTYINKIGKDSLDISILLSKSTENIKYFTNIKLNKDWKIYSIGNTVLTPYYEKPDSLKSSKKR